LHGPSLGRRLVLAAARDHVGHRRSMLVMG
jgi:hypothetical protein